MTRLRFALATVLALTASLQAQTSILTGARFTWDQPAPSLIAAQGYTYKLYTDGLSGALTLTAVTCVASAASGVYSCDVAVPAQIAGVTHTAQLTAQSTGGAESGPSNTYSYVFTMTTAAPLNLRKK